MNEARQGRSVLPAIAWAHLLCFPLDTLLGACTIIARNYLAHARTFAESVEQMHPGMPVFVLLLDGTDDLPLRSLELFTIISPEELGVPDLEALRFRYQLVEFATAIKPFFLKHLFTKISLSSVAFFDPDIVLYAPLDPVTDALTQHAIVLTPHITKPLPDDGLLPSEQTVLQAGIYNLGFIALRKCPMTDDFLEWWEQRLRKYCYNRVSDGYFVDQRWVDLAPALFPDVTILQDPGCNTAYWNLPHRTVASENARYTVDGVPLRFFHFSGFRPEQPARFSKHQTRLMLSRLPTVAALYEEYARRLQKNGYEEVRGIPYGYDRFETGEIVSAELRNAYAQPGISSIYQSPFSTGKGSFLESMRPTFARTKVELTQRLRSVLAARHQLEPYQRFCRVLKRKIGLKTYYRIAAALKLRGSSRNSVQAHIPPSLRPLTFGVNVVGYLNFISGVAEATRGNIRALEAVHIPHVVRPISFESITPFQAQELPYEFHLLQINADQMPLIAAGVGEGFFEHHTSIGYWMWEVSTFPQEYAASFTHLQEIWTASSYCQQIFEPHAPIPVRVMPHVVQCAPKGIKGRENFGIPKDHFIFLFAFDYLSIFERKNPLGLLKAFAKAFNVLEPVTLVLKSLNGHQDPPNRSALLESIKGVNCILLEESMPREDTEDLFACCDAFVSLHRSEGFGLSLAECMLLGKPVIATGFGGNTDFMHQENSYLVSSTQTTLAQPYGPYPAGANWAEPDTDHAAFCMRRVVDDPASARTIAGKGQATIRMDYCAQAIGKKMRDRLTVLATHQR